jgi:response regulator NasT
MERVIVAFEGEKAAQRFAEIIESSYVAKCIICHSADEVRRMVEKREVHVVVTGYKLHGWTAVDLAEDLPDSVLLLLVATESQLELCELDDIVPLPAPVSRADLTLAVKMALVMGRRLERLLRPKRSEEEKRLVDQVKQGLMERHHISEEEAHRLLQKRSMDNGTRMAQTARLLLEEWKNAQEKD